MRKYLYPVAACLGLLLLCSSSLWAREDGLTITCPDKAGLGQPFYLKLSSAEPLSKVRLNWLDRQLDLDILPGPDGGSEVVCPLAFSLKRKTGPHTLTLTVTRANGASEVVTRQIMAVKHDYPVQKLSVDKKFVDLSAADLKRHEEERKIVGQALSTMSGLKLWQCPFLKPVEGRYSSMFGLKRFFNGKEASNPHSGLDIAATEGTPVQAMADGIVLLAVDHYFSGQAVFLDHGQGLVSMYMHLSKINVSKGERVSRGQVVGLVGSTGRVTAAHLHLGINILGEAADPKTLLELPCP